MCWGAAQAFRDMRIRLKEGRQTSLILTHGPVCGTPTVNKRTQVGAHSPHLLRFTAGTGSLFQCQFQLFPVKSLGTRTESSILSDVSGKGARRPCTSLTHVQRTTTRHWIEERSKQKGRYTLQPEMTGNGLILLVLVALAHPLFHRV